MPFKNKRQRTWMAINKPSLYRKWVKKYGKNIGGGGSHKLAKRKRKKRR